MAILLAACLDGKFVSEADNLAADYADDTDLKKSRRSASRLQQTTLFDNPRLFAKSAANSYYGAKRQKL